MAKNNQQSITYPYARIKAMNEIMEFIRNPKWEPGVIDQEVIQVLNIAPSKEGLVVNALKFLSLADGNGQPTERFFGLKNDYKNTLEVIVREKYSEVFDVFPDDLIDQDRIVNFFMRSSGTTRDTAEYQGYFFGWICREAGIQLPNLPEKFKRARFSESER